MTIPTFLKFGIFLGSHLSSGYVAAMPTISTVYVTRDDSSSKTAKSSKIWTPILIIAVLIAVGSFALSWHRWASPRLRNRRWWVGGANSGPRELTAEELAGTINGTNSNNGPAANRSRRMRRTRRTPSQISIISLPVYAKEPGEQELVIIRGPEGMEDAGMPSATVVMEPVSDDGEHSTHSRNNSHSSHYPPMPATQDAPVLDRSNPSQAVSAQPTRPPGDIMPRPSTDTLQSSDGGTSLVPVSDDRGEAPPYTGGNLEPNSAIDLPPSSEHVPPRRSGLRTLLHSIPNRFLIHNSHTRSGSMFSVASSENAHGARETSQSRASHRPSISGSGSVLSLARFRTLSRQSNHDLNSPSLISLDSISAPLSHTLTRTEFTYPKSGPTPEQLKLISSPESFARFAVPYGPDAIAYANSASRHDLNEVPPPDFHAPAYESAGPSRLRTSSSAADMVSSGSLTFTQEASIEPILANDFPAVTSSLRVSTNPSSPRVNQADEISGINPLQIPLPPSPIASDKGPQSQLEIEALVLQKPSTIVPGLPPTSYRAPSMLESLSQSRASSAASFATAVSTVSSRSPSRSNNLAGNDIEDEVESPTTPRMATSYIPKSTDTNLKHTQS
ncbi:hypothetical protein C0992_000980 [Termitomyces sp. T32_za158]|nr:hypothetical protein C0992_000980 [Termitomyces sp. T32_za158]